MNSLPDSNNEHIFLDPRRGENANSFIANVNLIASEFDFIVTIPSLVEGIKDDVERAEDAANRASTSAEEAEQTLTVVKQVSEEAITTIEGLKEEIVEIGTTFLEDIADTGTLYLTDIDIKGNEFLAAISSEGTVQTSRVTTEGQEQVDRINLTGTTHVNEINRVSTAHISTINHIGTKFVSDIIDTGVVQLANINAVSNSTVLAVRVEGEKHTRLAKEEADRAEIIVEALPNFITAANQRVFFGFKYNPITTEMMVTESSNGDTLHSSDYDAWDIFPKDSTLHILNGQLVLTLPYTL